MNNSKIQIEGMTCKHCVETVTKALEGLSGVSGVAVVLEENCADLSYDAEKIQLSEIKKAVAATAFDVLGTA